jgi:hypothetical protein
LNRRRIGDQTGVVSAIHDAARGKRSAWSKAACSAGPSAAWLAQLAPDLSGAVNLTNHQVAPRLAIDMDEPLAPDAARRLIREILRVGRFTYSKHAMEELLADDLTTVDCENVLRGGVVRPGEFEHGSWRYRVGTIRITVVVAFRSERELVVVTAWRSGR